MSVMTNVIPLSTEEEKITVDVEIDGKKETVATCSIEAGAKIVNNLLTIENIIDAKT